MKWDSYLNTIIKKVGVLSVALGLCLCMVLPCYATQLYIENFTDQDADNLSSGGISATVNIRRAPATNATYDTDYEWATGRGGTGYALGDKAGGSGTAFLEFFPFSGTWPSDELYVSYWVRFADFTEDPDDMENIKMFYARWNGANGYVHYTLAGANTIYYSARANDGSTILEGGRYLSTTGITDGNWHHLEFWVKFSTALSRFWYDSALLVDSNYADTTGGSATWTATPYWFRIPAEDAEATDTFTRQVDDIEIHDSAPAGDETAPTVTAFTIPSTSSNLLVSISSFTCTDAVGVTGYLVNETADVPSATGAGWTATAPASYTFGSTGEKTLYGWCKDAANNVSTSGTDTVTVSQAISKAPFIIP